MRLNHIHLGDCLEWLKTIPDESVDIIWTDPPYGNNQNKGDLNASLKKRNSPTAKLKTILNDDPASWEKLMRGLIREANRILKPTGCMCCCCGGGGGRNVSFARLAIWLDRQMQFDQAVVWNKGGLGLGWRYRRNYEFVMVSHRKGGKLKWEATFADKRTANVVDIPRVPHTQNDHPTPKPVELVEHFLRLHGKKYDVVCDPFAGSGTTCVAALSMGMHFIACELDPQYYCMAMKRITDLNPKIFKGKPKRVRRAITRTIPHPTRSYPSRRITKRKIS